MSYTELLPTVLVVAALLWLPGIVVLRAASVPVLWSVAAAPLVGVITVVVAGLLGHLWGLRMDSHWGALVILTVWVILTLAARLSGVGRQVRGLPQPHRSWPTVAVWAVAGGLFAGVFAIVTGSPDAWPQQGDNIYHVGAATWMVREGSVWVGDVPQYSGPMLNSLPYPGAWHAIVSLASMWTGTSPLATSHALVLLVGGLVWPSAMTVLAWRAASTNSVTSAIASLAAFAFYGMPYHPLAWGVQWPFFLGMALMPWVIRCLYLVVDDWQDGPVARARAVSVLGVTLGVAAVCHTSTIYLSALVAPLIFFPSLWSRLAPATRWGGIAATGLAMGGLWYVRPPSMVDPQLVISASATAAARRLAGTLAPIWPLGLATLVIAVVAALLACRRADRVWIPVLLFGCVAVNSLFVLLPKSVTAAITWPWWGDFARFAIIAAIPAGVAVTVFVATHVLPSIHAGHARATIAVVPLTLALAINGLLSAAVIRLSYEVQDPTIAWVSTDERDQLKALATEIPEHAVVAADPYRGATQIYLSRDVRLLYPTTRPPDTVSPDLALIARRIDQAAEDPVVCAALRRAGVQLVVTGGDQTPTGRGEGDLFAGFDGVSDAPGFERLTTSGAFELWLPPAACQRPG